MRIRSRLVSVLAAALLLSSGAALRAQTTGRIQGQVVDAQGGGDAGSHCHGHQPGASGRADARSPTLTAGSVSQRPSGPLHREGRACQLQDRRAGQHRSRPRPHGHGRRDDAACQRDARASRSPASSPIIDSTSTVTGVVADAEFLSRLPVRRDIYSATTVRRRRRRRRRRARPYTARAAPRTSTSSTASTRPASSSAARART